MTLAQRKEQIYNKLSKISQSGFAINIGDNDRNKFSFFIKEICDGLYKEHIFPKYIYSSYTPGFLRCCGVHLSIEDKSNSVQINLAIDAKKEINIDIVLSGKHPKIPSEIYHIGKLSILSNSIEEFAEMVSKIISSVMSKLDISFFMLIELKEQII